MKHVTIALTDQYMVTHPEAVCLVEFAHRDQSSHTSLTLNQPDGDHEQTRHESDTVHYGISFWHCPEAQKAKAERIHITPTSKPLNFDMADPLYAELGLEDACIQHFTTVVAPTLATPASEEDKEA